MGTDWEKEHDMILSTFCKVTERFDDIKREYRKTIKELEAEIKELREGK